MAATKKSFPPSEEGIFTHQGPGEKWNRVVGKPVSIFYRRAKDGRIKQTHIACISTVRDDDNVEHDVLVVSFAKTATEDMKGGTATRQTGRAVAAHRLAKFLKKSPSDRLKRLPHMIGVWGYDQDPDSSEPSMKMIFPPMGIFKTSDSESKKNVMRRAWVDLPNEDRLLRTFERLGTEIEE